jgi:lysophospholipase L1-like esterase
VTPNFAPGDQPTATYRELAAGGAWEFVDAGAAVETTDGSFDPTLRDPDGVHLNDAGVARFAAAIADYLVSGTENTPT